MRIVWIRVAKKCSMWFRVRHVNFEVFIKCQLTKKIAKTVTDNFFNFVSSHAGEQNFQNHHIVPGRIEYSASSIC